MNASKYGISFRWDKKCSKIKIVVMVIQLVNILKITVLYTSNG